MGCRQCKQRRIKCLETLPACEECVKARDICEYLNFSPEELQLFQRRKIQCQPPPEHKSLSGLAEVDWLPLHPEQQVRLVYDDLNMSHFEYSSADHRFHDEHVQNQNVQYPGTQMQVVQNHLPSYLTVANKETNPHSINTEDNFLPPPIPPPENRNPRNDESKPGWHHQYQS